MTPVTDVSTPSKAELVIIAMIVLGATVGFWLMLAFASGGF